MNSHREIKYQATIGTTLWSNPLKVILDCQIKTHDGWVAGVKFLSETGEKRAQSTTSFCKKTIDELNIKLSHPTKSSTHATTKDMGIKLTGTFKPCEDCTLGKVKQKDVSNKTGAWSKSLGERLFFDISFPLPPGFGGKKHWLLLKDDGSSSF